MKVESKAVLAGWKCFIAAFVVLAMVCVPLGCDDDDDDDSSSGSGGPSTVNGNVASFEGPGVVYIPQQPKSFVRRLWAGVGEAIIPSALAAAGGVSVSVVGTDISTTTSGDGSFSLGGVPAGRQELVFSMGAHSAILELDVPGDSVIELRDVQVTPDGVIVGDILIVETIVTFSGSPSSGDDGSEDYDSEDADSQDNDSSDSN